jgi:Flp pilus assembly protein TadG
VELAIILPILLAMAGGAVDLARAYQAWLTLESATRNAAEYLATMPTITTQAQADAAAEEVVCRETDTIPGWIQGSGGNPCDAPDVSVPTFTTSTTATGATFTNPIATAQVVTSVEFQTLVPWPLLPHDAVTLSADRTYSIVRNK